MKAYTYQIGDGTDDAMPAPLYSEEMFADSLGEAIDKAKAITRLRPPHEREHAVRIVEKPDDAMAIWASSIEDIRAA